MEHVIIVAGGKGTRMGTDIPKQFLLINGMPVLMHTLEAFYRYNPAIDVTVALPADQLCYWAELCQKYQFNVAHRLVEGGETRFHSVYNALQQIRPEGLVAIHDGVRPLVSTETITRCFATAAEKGNAVPVLLSVESIREVTGPDTSKAVDRSKYRMVQTPQVFKTHRLVEAYRQPYTDRFTDDASVVERLGDTIHLVDGNPENIKITNSIDLLLAEAMLKSRV